MPLTCYPNTIAGWIVHREWPLSVLFFSSLSLSFFFKVIAFTLDYDLARFNRTLPASDRLNQIKKIKKALMLWQGETSHVWICVSCTRTGHWNVHAGDVTQRRALVKNHTRFGGFGILDEWERCWILKSDRSEVQYIIFRSDTLSFIYIY